MNVTDDLSAHEIEGEGVEILASDYSVKFPLHERVGFPPVGDMAEETALGDCGELFEGDLLAGNIGTGHCWVAC